MVPDRGCGAAWPGGAHGKVNFDGSQYPGRSAADTEEELTDTGLSPIKINDHHMLDMEKNAKKRLAFDHVNKKGVVPLALTNSRHTDGDTLLQTKESVEHAEKDKKRHKREDGTSLSEQSNGSAASLEDDRREQ